ncbi:MAG: Stp1/IreP family PP2C-type Ser/Thr phosphatase [Deltaproteobacteria bacterium]|nr:MAG: Stp1/IreP family PP2C-type Ser/Thr phosphatase [Deltaproteobacteria bacterium]
MRLIVSGATDVGKKRSHNEDAMLIDETHALFVVADGMGGHEGGEIASQKAVEIVAHHVKENYATLKENFHRQSAEDFSRISSFLENVVSQASFEIHGIAEKKKIQGGIGTTLTILLVLGNHGFVAHVGDSRLYLVRKGHVHQITEDHTLLQEHIRNGKLTPEEIIDFPHKNILTRSVGVYPHVEADTFHFVLLPGDFLLLCSDGLHNYLQDNEIEPLIRSVKGEFRAEPFIQLANARGGADNITVIVIEADEGVSPQEADQLHEQFNLRMDTLKNVPLYRDLSYKELVKIFNITQVHTYRAGETIFNEGEEGSEFCIILSGEIELSTHGKPFKRMRAGTHFGEMSLIDQQPRSATVTAVVDTKLLVISRKDFIALLRSDTHLASKLLWRFLMVVSRRLRDATARYTELQAQVSGNRKDG